MLPPFISLAEGRSASRFEKKGRKVRNFYFKSVGLSNVF